MVCIHKEWARTHEVCIMKICNVHLHIDCWFFSTSSSWCLPVSYRNQVAHQSFVCFCSLYTPYLALLYTRCIWANFKRIKDDPTKEKRIIAHYIYVYLCVYMFALCAKLKDSLLVLCIVMLIWLRFGWNKFFFFHSSYSVFVHFIASEF